MADYQITLDAAEIQALLTKTQGLAPVVEQVLNRVIAAEVTAFLQAGRYERTATRQDPATGPAPGFWRPASAACHARCPGSEGAASSPRCSPATNGVSRPSWPR